MKRGARIAIGIVVAVLALPVLVVAFFEIFGWNPLRGPVARVVSAQTGRPFAIRGNLDVDLGLTPRIRADGLELADAPWTGTRAPMAQVQRLEVDIRLPDLLRGRVNLPRIALLRPQAALVRRADGTANWTLDTAPAGEGGSPPRIGVIEVRQGRVTLADAVRQVQLDAALDAGQSAGTDAPGSTRLQATGRYNGGRFRLSAEAGSLDAYAGREAFPLQLDLRTAQTRLRFKGTLGAGGAPDPVSGDVAVQGQDLADLYALTGLVLPNSPPYAVRTQLRRRGPEIALDGIEGFVGDSDLSGKASVTLREPRPHLKATLHSRRLDFDDLGAAVGAPPATQGAETASPEQKAQARALKSERRLLPDTPLDTARMHAMDADVSYRAASVSAGGLPMRNVRVNVKLADGVLRMDPARITFPQGSVALRGTLDAGQTPPASDLDVVVRRLRLEDLLPRVGEQPAIAAALHGRATLRGRGNSVRAFAADAEGRVGLALDGGHMSHLIVELLGLDVAEALGVLAGDDEPVAIRCAAVALDARQGRLTPATFLLDTDDSVITASGSADLVNERLDLTLDADSKGPSLLSGQAPVTVKGPLRSPGIGVEAAPLAARGAAAVALGTLLSPVAALLAFVDPGLAKDSDCAGALGEAGQAAQPGASKDSPATPTARDADQTPPDRATGSDHAARGHVAPAGQRR